MIWRCHVGIDTPNDLAHSAWRFLAGYVDAAEGYVFSRESFFWDDLDYIGVEGFWPLINGKDPRHDNPSVDVLRQGWGLNFLKEGQPPGIELRDLHIEYQRPVLLTGLGYVSRGGTSAAPFKGDYTQAAAGGKVNDQAQERPYKAAWPVGEAIAELDRQRARQFDPTMVDAFLRIVDQPAPQI